MESATETKNDFKELVYARWKFAERRCYYLIGATGAAIGYALVAVPPVTSLPETIVLSAAVFIWAVGVFWGRRNLMSIQDEIEEIHRNMLVPSVYDRGTEPFSASWAKERDRLITQQRQHEELQFGSLAFGGVIYSMERLGWLGVLADMVQSS